MVIDRPFLAVLINLWGLFHLSQVCDFEDEAFGLFPAEAGVGYRLAVDAAVGLLVAVLDIGFYHQALEDAEDIAREA